MSGIDAMKIGTITAKIACWLSVSCMGMLNRTVCIFSSVVTHYMLVVYSWMVAVYIMLHFSLIADED